MVTVTLRKVLGLTWCKDVGDPGGQGHSSELFYRCLVIKLPGRPLYHRYDSHLPDVL